MALAIRIESEVARRAFMTPEGVPLELTLAPVSDRITAFCIDAILVSTFFVAAAILSCLSALGGISWVLALMNVVGFLLLNGYFIWFELKSSGQTPGKKALGIRVVSRTGGPLRADAVIARNLVRDIEVFLPLALLAFHEAVMPDTSAWTWVAATAWVLVLALVPVFNRDRLRVGDLVGGTWVVKSPKASLHRDLARRATAAPGAPAPQVRRAYEFAPAQLEIYGVYELQALEDVLRNRNPEAPKLREAVAEKIVRKIGYPAPVEPDRFLPDFYAALRAHLERRMLFGQRKERKDR